MGDFFQRLFSSDFMPHGMCYLWNPAVLWLNVISDGFITLAYYGIPFLLFAFFRKRKDITFRWVFVAFAGFILACGTTHLMGVWTVWHGTYRLDGMVKALTAVASVASGVLLLPLMPILVNLPSPTVLQKLNRQLQGEIEERKRMAEALHEVNEQLEQRVQERTAELQESAGSLEQSNRELREQIERTRRLEDQLLQAQKMEAVGRLAGGVAHDFNNLLTVISGYNRMILEEPGNHADVLEWAGEVQNASQRAASLTSQLLAFSRRQIAQPRLLNLNETVSQMEKLLRRVIGEDIDLETHLAPELGVVYADPNHLDQLIMNLVVNARDAMPHGGKLTIETANVDLDEAYASGHAGVVPGQYVQLAISDTGEGISESVRSRIFEPFFTTKETGKGTGLGLSIVYGIVKQNGGDIWVYSQEGKGTTFKIYLPLARPGSMAQPGKNAEAESQRGTETVLLVEDEERVRKLVSSILKKQGYTVLESQSGQDAIRISQAHDGPIHLLLTDVVMPETGGPELAEQLCGPRPEMKVLYMSGYADKAIVRHGELQADAAFIQKPFAPEALHHKIREVLRS